MNRDNRKNQVSKHSHQQAEQFDLGQAAFGKNPQGSPVIVGGDGTTYKPIVRFRPVVAGNVGKEYDLMASLKPGSKFGFVWPKDPSKLTSAEWIPDLELRKPLTTSMKFRRDDKNNTVKAWLPTGQRCLPQPGFHPKLDETCAYRYTITPDRCEAVAIGFANAAPAAEAQPTVAPTASRPTRENARRRHGQRPATEKREEQEYHITCSECQQPATVKLNRPPQPGTKLRCQPCFTTWKATRPARTAKPAQNKGESLPLWKAAAQTTRPTTSAPAVTGVSTVMTTTVVKTVSSAETVCAICHDQVHLAGRTLESLQPDEVVVCARAKCQAAAMA